MTRRFAALLTTLACLATPALAHDDATLDAMAAPHGGQIRMAGPLHMELVLAKDAKATQDSPITVYLTDHAGKAITAQGASGSITLLAGKTKVTAELKPAGDNRLQASARYAAAPGLKAVVGVSLPGQPEQQARFTPLAGKAQAADPHAGHAGH